MRINVKVKDIKPNPFRKIESYPILEEKVEALVSSIESTGFWDNLVARPAEEGCEIAYGHHRLEALRRTHDPEDEIGVELRELDDATMLRIMANENMEEWSGTAEVVLETVSSVVQAYGEGRIELDAVPEKTSHDRLRYAPSFVQGDGRAGRNDHPYTAQTVSDFLGWSYKDGQPSKRVKYALRALELVEIGALEERAIRGQLTRGQLRAVVEQANRAKAQAEAVAQAKRKEAEEARLRADRAEEEGDRRLAERKAEALEKEAQAYEIEAVKSSRAVSNHLADGMKKDKSDRMLLREAEEEADKVLKERKKSKEKAIENEKKNAVKQIRSLETQLHNYLHPDYKRRKKLDKIIEWRMEGIVSEKDAQVLANTLRELAGHAEEIAQQLTAVEYTEYELESA